MTVALLASVALLNLPSAVLASSPGERAEALAGSAVVFGSVTVDGSAAVSGQTFFSGSTIATGEGSHTALDLGNLARLELSPETALKLDFTDAGVGGALDSGRARVSVPTGVRAAFTTHDATVTADASRPTVFSVQVERDGTTVSVHTGRVEMRAGGEARALGAGQLYSTSREPKPAQSQGQGLSDRERAAFIIGITAAITAILFAITRGDDIEPPICEPGPIVPSGPSDPSPC